MGNIKSTDSHFYLRSDALSKPAERIKALAKCTSPNISLTLHFESISDEKLDQVADAVTSNPSMQKLFLEIKFSWKSEDGFEMENSKLKRLLRRMMAAPTFTNKLVRMKLDGKLLAEYQKPFRAFLRRHSKSLRTLEYEGTNDFTHLSSLDCFSSLKRLHVSGSRLQSFYESHTELDDEQFQQLESVLKTSANLQELSVSECKPLSITKLALPPNLRTLSVPLSSAQEGFTDASVRFLTGMKSLHNLEELELSYYCGTTDDTGFSNIFSALDLTIQCLPNFTRLKLKSRLSNEELVQLKPVLSRLRSLTLNQTFCFGTNTSATKSTDFWRSIFESCSSLETLVFAGSWTSETASLATSFPALVQASSLKTLGLPALTQLSSKSYDTLLQTLQDPKCLIYKLRTISRDAASRQDLVHQLGLNALRSSKFLARAPLALYPRAFVKLAGLPNKQTGAAYHLLRQQCGILVQEQRPKRKAAAAALFEWILPQHDEQQQQQQQPKKKRRLN